MKKMIAWLLVLALAAAISVGATLAYLTDTDEDVNVMTLGKVKIDQLEYERIDDETADADAKVQEFRDNKPLLPAVTDKDFDYTHGDTYVDWEQIGKEGYTSDIWNPAKINNEVDKMVFVKNKGDYDAYVRSVFAFEAGKYTTVEEFRKMVHLNLNETDWTWSWTPTPITIGESTYFVATATYNEVLAPGALTEISLSQIALDKTATNADVEAFGETYQVLVKSQAIQADGFDEPVFALNQGFGAVTATSVPWENDSPTKGIDLRTALHYYEGDAAKQITSQISTITFGKADAHAATVAGYDGTLVDVEQDVPVYAYYVPNGANYDVYFLADSAIYLPADSTFLMANMGALTKVDTANLDVSRVENMHQLFSGDKQLAAVDVSKWDTSLVTDMTGLFYQCKVLDGLDVSKWNVSNVTNLQSCFNQCDSISYLDVSNWDVRKVKSTAKMFYNTLKMENLVGLGNWKTSSLEACNSMFSSLSSNSGNMPYTELDIENFDTSNVVQMQCMFYGCGNLQTLDLSKWDVSKVVDMHHMFADCYSITEINFGNWNTASMQCFAAMFNNCDSIKVLDVSSFDLQNADDCGQMFEYCCNLEQIIGLDKWETPKLLTMYELFSGCSKLKEIDLSSWNTSNVFKTFRAFNNCTSLETIYVGDGWDMSNVTGDTRQMFSNCNMLVGGKGTTYMGTDLKYACVDGGVDAPGYMTYKSVQKPET